MPGEDMGCETCVLLQQIFQKDKGRNSKGFVSVKNVIEPFDERLEWLPKSAILIKDDWLGIDDWLTYEKDLIWAKAIVCNLDGDKLLARKGWKLMQLTGEQRLVLLEEGLAILQ